MKRLLLITVAAAAPLCCTTTDMAQARDFNVMGWDYGWFHPTVPAQVTTYFPPEPAAVDPARHRRPRRPAS